MQVLNFLWQLLQSSLELQQSRDTFYKLNFECRAINLRVHARRKTYNPTWIKMIE